MFILNNTNGKIKGIKFCINNVMTMFLTDGETVDISLEDNTLDDFILKIKNIDESISEDFLKKLYEFYREK